MRRAAARLPKASSGRVVSDLALWNQASRIGGGLTPQRISSIVREADTGDVRRLIDLANECRQRDAHLQAVCSVSEETIASMPWQIVPTADKPRAKDKRAAAWVEETLRALPEMHRLIADLTGAVFYSFAVSEIVWKKEGGRLVPDRFIPVAQRRFRFRRTDGALVLHDEGSPEIDLFETYPNKFIVSRPRVTGDVPTREGLARVLVWMSAMRNWSIGDWLKTGELSWKPWRIGTYKKSAPGASRTDREDLEDVMRKLTTDFSAVIPDSAEIRIEWPGGSTTRASSHAEIVNSLANEMSKAVLGQTETTQASSSSGYAQAKVHESVRRDLQEARARAIAADITRDLVAPMIALNFGPTVEVPRFQFASQDPIDLKAFSEAIATLRTAGARIPEAWVFEQAGIPTPAEGERLLGDDEPTPAQNPQQDPNASNVQDPNAPKPAPVDPAEGEPPTPADDAPPG